MGENSDIGLMKTKNEGSGKVYKMVGQTIGLTEPCFFVLYICNKIRYKYKYIYYYRRENIGSVLHSYRKIELSCASSWKNKHNLGC